MKYILIFILSILIFSCESKREPFAEYTEFDKEKIFGEWILVKKEKYLKNKLVESKFLNEIEHSWFMRILTDSSLIYGLKSNTLNRISIFPDTQKIKIASDSLYTKSLTFQLKSIADTMVYIDTQLRDDTMFVLKLIKYEQYPNMDSIEFYYIPKPFYRSYTDSSGAIILERNK